MELQWALPHRLIPPDVGQPNERDFCRLFISEIDQCLTTKKLSYPRQSRGFISVSPSKGQKHEAPEGADSHT